MQTKGVMVSPTLIGGAVVVLLGMGVWLAMATMNDNSTVADATATPTPTASAVPTPSASASPSATPTPTATPKASPAAGWARYNLAGVGVSFDYPKTLQSLEASVSDRSQFKDEKAAGFLVTATLKTKSNTDETAIYMWSESIDYRSEQGRGSTFYDYDGFEKNGATYKLYRYEWENGNKFEVDLSSNHPGHSAEAVTTDGNLSALIVKGGMEQEAEPGNLDKDQFAAIVMLPAATGYRAVSFQTINSNMTYSDFTAIVKSFHLTN